MRAKKQTALKRKPAAKKAAKKPDASRARARVRAQIAKVARDREGLAAAESEVRRLRAARRRLEQRLTAAVQEIGTLRTFELRAQMLENEVAKRDAELTRLRAEMSDRLGGASIVSTPAEARVD